MSRRTWLAGISLVLLGIVFGSLGTTSNLLFLGVGVFGILGPIVWIAWHSSQPGTGAFGPTLVRGTSTQQVALTFDDGPHPTATPQILKALGTEHRATFFVLVDRAEQHPELLRQMAEHHQIALHGLTHHPWLTIREPSAGAAELREARKRLETLIGRPVTDYRPPFGAVSPRVYASAAMAGLRMVWCTVRTRDGVRVAPERLRGRVAEAVAGDIVLLHDGPAWTVEALPTLLNDLEARGLHSTTVEDLCPAS